MMNPDHYWRYNPHWKDKWNDENWYIHRRGSVIADLIKSSGYGSQMENFYKYCREVFKEEGREGK